VKIGATILSLMLLAGLSLAAQTSASVPSGAGDRSPLLSQSRVVAGNGPSVCALGAGDTLHVDLEAFNSGLGLFAGGAFFAAARLSPAKACTVSAVIFYKWDASYDDYLFVWGKGTDSEPGQLIESVPYTGADTMAWQTVNLPILVPLAGATDDIWVGPRINHGGGTHPLGIDDGPAAVGRNWINSDGRWVELRSVGYDVNWHIRALLGHGGIPAHDVGAELVLAPKDTVALGPIAPMARIRNFGANPVTRFPVVCKIDSADSVVFTDTTVFTGTLAPSETADVTFPRSWTGVPHKAYYRVTVFTSLSEDSVPSNDTAHASIVPTIDVGADVVMAPKDTVAPESIAPMARIRNFGFNPVSGIPVICQIDSASQVVFTDTTTYAGPLAPSDTATVTFAKNWTGVARSPHYQVAIFTKLLEDSVQTNDSAYGSVVVVPTIDVGAEAVLAPKDTVAPESIAPMARIRNFGFNSVDSVPVICQIDSTGHIVFTDTTYTDSLARSGTANVTFLKKWTGVIGNDYGVAMFTVFPDDSVQANDTVYASVSVQAPGVEEQPAKLGGSVDRVLPTLVRDRVRINFTVVRRGNVNLGVYDATGSLVRTLVDGTLDPGSQSATWDRTDSNGRRVADGTYFYRLVVDGRAVSSKSVLFN